MNAIQKCQSKPDSEAGPGQFFAPKDFLDLESHDAADRSLSRLVEEGVISSLFSLIEFSGKIRRPAMESYPGTTRVLAGHRRSTRS